jgi:DNA-3-methyladenine glycosylase II
VIPFQQVSLAAAVATLRRLVLALSAPVALGGTTAWPFPAADAIAGASPTALRACGLSDAKAGALRGACRAVTDGALVEAALEALPTDALVARLREVAGIGPWSAALLALRGFGRLDVFPPGDAAAVKRLGEAGDASLPGHLGPFRGMLCYALFLRPLLALEPGSLPGVNPTEPGPP